MDNENMNDSQKPQNSRAKEIIYKITGWNYLKRNGQMRPPCELAEILTYIL